MLLLIFTTYSLRQYDKYVSFSKVYKIIFFLAKSDVLKQLAAPKLVLFLERRQQASYITRAWATRGSRNLAYYDKQVTSPVFIAIAASAALAQGQRTASVSRDLCNICLAAVRKLKSNKQVQYKLISV